MFQRIYRLWRAMPCKDRKDGGYNKCSANSGVDDQKDLRPVELTFSRPVKMNAVSRVRFSRWIIRIRGLEHIYPNPKFAPSVERCPYGTTVMPTAKQEFYIDFTLVCCTKRRLLRYSSRSNSFILTEVSLSYQVYQYTECRERRCRGQCQLQTERMRRSLGLPSTCPHDTRQMLLARVDPPWVGSCYCVRYYPAATNCTAATA